MGKTLLYLLVTTLVVTLSGTGSAGPTFLDKTVEFIAPANPGGGWDLTCRLSAKVLQEEKLISQPIIVTNMPGSAGAVAIAHVVTSRKGDPYTLIAFSPSLTLAIVNRRTPYTYKDITPVTALTTADPPEVSRRSSGGFCIVA